MARIRTIKPEFPQSESMGNVTREARLLFILLWPFCDDHGKARGSSRLLASLLYPYDKDVPDLIDVWFDELVHERCVVRYEVEGAHYVKVTKWLEHQKIDRPSASKFPDPSEGSIFVAKPREPSSQDQGSRTEGRDQGPGPGPAPSATPREPQEPEPASPVGADAPRTPPAAEQPAPPADPTKPSFEPQPDVDSMDPPLANDRRPEAMALKVWNETAERIGLPLVQRLTDPRRKALKARLSESGGLDGWSTALAKVEASSFLTGKTGRTGEHANWRCNLDFLIKQGPFTKLMEGGFDDSPGTPRQSNLSTNLEALAEFGRTGTG